MPNKKILDHFDIKDELIEEWKLFLGSHQEYYVREWLKVRDGHVFSLNFSALFFGIFWLLYRKMYQPAVLVLSIFFAEGFLETIVFSYRNFYVHLLYWNISRICIFSVFLGLLGNWIFYNYSQMQIGLIKDRFPESYKKQLAAKGGTSFIPILALLSFFALTYTLQFYFLRFR